MEGVSYPFQSCLIDVIVCQNVGHMPLRMLITLKMYSVSLDSGNFVSLLYFSLCSILCKGLNNTAGMQRRSLGFYVLFL